MNDSWIKSSWGVQEWGDPSNVPSYHWPSQEESDGMVVDSMAGGVQLVGDSVDGGFGGLDSGVTGESWSSNQATWGSFLLYNFLLLFLICFLV